MTNTQRILPLALLAAVAVSGCSHPDRMSGRWVFEHPIPMCWTLVEITPSGQYIETLKLEDREPVTKVYSLKIKGHGLMNLISTEFAPRSVKYSVIGDIMRVKEPQGSRDEYYKRWNKKETPWHYWESNNPLGNRAEKRKQEREQREAQQGGGAATPGGAPPAGGAQAGAQPGGQGGGQPGGSGGSGRRPGRSSAR